MTSPLLHLGREALRQRAAEELVEAETQFLAWQSAAIEDDVPPVAARRTVAGHRRQMATAYALLALLTPPQ